MTKLSTTNRLARLEAARRGPGKRICCVQFGDGPQRRPDGSICTIDHNKVITLGGDAIHVIWSDGADHRTARHDPRP